jgi:hypothetical protein
LVLENERWDLAVAQGAAYYGMVLRGEGVRVAANLARTYYVGVQSETPTAVCLVPGNAEPGQDFALSNRPLKLTISEPVEFPLHVSSVRLLDQPGDLVPIDPESMTALPPIRTVLHTQRRSDRGTVPALLHAKLTEIGTIDLWCSEVGAARRWRLQFDVRRATQTDIAAHEGEGESGGFIDENQWQACYELLSGVFRPQGEDSPGGLMKRLSRALDQHRNRWPPSLLRRIWEALMDMEAGRRRSAEHEARWLNLLGFALRPGYGFAVDDWRVAESWRHLHGKLAHRASFSESLILWRRIAGGLSLGQQVTVAERWLAHLRVLYQHYVRGGKRRQSELLLKPQDSVEVCRLLGSLELLPLSVKVETGDMLVELQGHKKLKNARAAMVWAVGRLGQRVPVYGPLNTVVSRDTAADWLESLLRLDYRDAADQLAVMQLARRTKDRHRDLADELRDRAVEWLAEAGAPGHWIELVREGGQLDSEEQERIVGDSLPQGLRL